MRGEEGQTDRANLVVAGEDFARLAAPPRAFFERGELISYGLRSI